MSSTHYQDSVDYLLSLGNEVSAMKLGLENIRRLLHALGDPQKNYLKIQVAGTNGKGSVCAFLDAICRSADIRTGVYTSPHLVSMTERIRIAGVEISEDDFARFAAQVRATCEKLVTSGDLKTVPTYFEQVTAVGLVAFAEAGVELAILETGLGGRLDATTAADAEIAVITRLDLDHQEYLGETIEEIAAEKAAIIRPHSKVIIGEQSSRAMAVVDSVCAVAGVIPVRTGSISDKIPERQPTEHPAAQTTKPFPVLLPAFRTSRSRYENVSLGLAGAHQIENAEVAILVAEILSDEFEITPESITDGLRDARHAGRLEWTEYKGMRVLLDGAHNESGAKALAAYLTAEYIDAKIVLLYGTMKGKAYGSILKILLPLAGDVVLTQPENTRAVPAAEIAGSEALCESKDRTRVRQDVGEAIALAVRLAEQQGVRSHSFVLVTGSLYLVGDIKRVINKTNGNLQEFDGTLL